jgi:uncharacterized membrane protein (UPF0127 family)
LPGVWLIALILPLPAFSQGEGGVDDLDASFATSTIIIEADRDACYRFDVYLAITRQQQLRGLMHVRRLPPFRGMLFLYTNAEPAIHSMWMKNTYISLDILFIRKDGTIANIETHTEPLSLDSIRSSEPVSYVLELNAGVTGKLAVTAGNRVHFSQAGNPE